ncbi:hypothetical protein RHSIM_Rhsim07G0130800 [Rhododendron simsii]|uniref:Phosphatidylinositol-glycan biosynthesis class X protein n=1 Tax=Rhododendron simsii TaxID=118357 RepID=A0A834LJG4_RHOSS|nr:hypothetical protein RHSIM_Rhsim07G0130800 [Rhododendron simsii]
MEMRSGGKWNSSTVRAEDTFAPAIAVVEIEERAGDDDSELLLISSSATFPQHSSSHACFLLQRIYLRGEGSWTRLQKSIRSVESSAGSILVIAEAYESMKPLCSFGFFSSFRYYMEVQAHKRQIFLPVGILLTALAILGSCMHAFLVSSSEEGKYGTNSDVQPFPKLHKFIAEPYFKKRDSLLDSDFGSFISNKLPLDSCAILQDKLNFMPRLSVLKRYLIGEGSHRRLLSSIGLNIEPVSVAELPRNLCKVISIERLPYGVFADPFELQHLLQRGVLRDAAVFGDTNLELPTSVSNCSVVEIHVDVAHNVFSGHMNGVEVNIELPLHARYPPLGELAFSRVEFGGPNIFVQCNIEGKSHNHSCLFIPTGNSAEESQTGIAWDIPCGIKEHNGIVSVVTFVSAVVSAFFIVLATICNSDIQTSAVM